MNKMIGLSKKERTPLIYDPRTKEAFDGVKHFTTTKCELNQWSVTNSYKSEYIPIKKETDKSLEETYNAFIQRAEKLKKQSRGKINLFKSGTLQKASLALFFFHANKLKIVPEPLTELETKWLINTNHGQMVYKDKTKDLKDLHSYDINSMYASLLRNVYFKIPIKQGTFMKLTRAEFYEAKFYKYGIYRVEIENDGKPNTRKMFRFNHNNYYTTTDLNMATKLKLKINLMENEEFNFLSYGKGTTTTGSVLFKSFVDMLYKMRMEHKNNDFKKILNLLWGTLCSTNIHTFQYDITKDLDVNINLDPDRHIILNQFFVRENIFKLEYCKKDDYFKYPWARMKCFLLALGRQTITRIIEPYLENIMDLNTDGFKSIIELENIELGDGVGELRYEGIV
jgi:hypothetical protein